MRYKRNETFRYEFGKPLSGHFKILRINGQDVESKLGKADIFDLSPEGLKVETDLDLHKDNEVDIEVTFTIITEQKLTGEVVWQKRNYSGKYQYGIHLYNDAENKDKLINELKEYSKKLLNEKYR
ncbi:PilZ domain-containing protein [Bacillus sp. AK031]